jgi:hypothetical protein
MKEANTFFRWEAKLFPIHGGFYSFVLGKRFKKK